MTRAPVTVITATIPGREELLGKTLRSVYEQTIEVEAHLVMAQSCTEGLVPPHHVALQQNQLLDAVRSTFTMRLADDDQLLPHHIATFLPHFDDADVIYSFDANNDRPRVDCNGWGQDRLVAAFTRANWIDGSAVAIRTDLLRQVGGWPTDWTGGGHTDGTGRFLDTGVNAEDWGCFLNLARAGARFRCIPEPTWLYGNGGWVRSSNGPPAPAKSAPLRLAHFFHAYAVNDWERIVSGHLDALENSGLADEIGTLHLGIVGARSARNAVVRMCRKRMPVEVVAQAERGWEQITLEALRKRADTFDAVLYAHTKGVSKPAQSNDALEDEWRESMTVGVVDNWRQCVLLLARYDAVGCHWICHPEANRFCSEPGTMLFGGNFWWARADMIRRLEPPHTKSRYDAELWFGHNGVDNIFDLAPGWPGAGNFTRRGKP